MTHTEALRLALDALSSALDDLLKNDGTRRSIPAVNSAIVECHRALSAPAAPEPVAQPVVKPRLTTDTPAPPSVPEGWISVAEKMPPPDAWLLVVWGGHKAVDKAHTFTKWKHTTNPLGYLIQGHPGSHNDVTHWMPLPAAPQPGAPTPTAEVE